jgi:hypothetical protein
MTWAQRLKRVFGIEIESCEHCGGEVKVIAIIEDPAVIQKILTHLQFKERSSAQSPPARAPFGARVDQKILGSTCNLQGTTVTHGRVVASVAASYNWRSSPLGNFNFGV